MIQVTITQFEKLHFPTAKTLCWYIINKLQSKGIPIVPYPNGLSEVTKGTLSIRYDSNNLDSHYTWEE